MIKKYFQKNRDKLFPLLKDKWDSDEFRNEILPKLKSMDVNKMSQQMWFFFHPSAYQLMYWGCNWVVILASLYPFIYSIINDKSIMMFSFGSIIFIMSYNFYTRWKSRHMFPPKHYTFYENWIKNDEE